MSKTLVEKLAEIQSELKAPKNQFNSFGGYNYRSLEDILEAVKPLLKERGLILTISDEMISVGQAAESTKNYIKVTATITDGNGSISVNSVARESDSKKGMDSSQLTGATSSYARKYALNGLFLIDDTKDADTEESGGKSAPAKPVKAEAKEPAKTSFRRKKAESQGESDDDI